VLVLDDLLYCGVAHNCPAVIFAQKANSFNMSNRLLLTWEDYESPVKNHCNCSDILSYRMFPIVGWIFGFYTPENATFRDWYELIASISVVVFVLVYSAVKRFKRSSVS